jgi:hypothetical protein
MAPDFRKSKNNNKGGVNSPSSFQDGKKDESLIEKYFKESYIYYSKYNDLTSQAMLEIFKKGDFSPVAINALINRIRKEKITELKNKYPEVLKDEDFSSDKIKGPSSGTIDSMTQRILWRLRNKIAKEEGMTSAEAIEELAGLEYMEKHLEEAEVKAKIVIANRAKDELKSENKDGTTKGQEINKPKGSSLTTNEQEKETEKLKKDKSKTTKKKAEESKPIGSSTTGTKEVSGGNPEETTEYDDDDTTSVPVEENEAIEDDKEITERLKSVPNFEDKVEKIKRDLKEEKNMANVSMYMPVSHVIPNIPSQASPQTKVSASIHISPSAPSSTPQPSPPQGGGESMGICSAYVCA